MNHEDTKTQRFFGNNPEKNYGPIPDETEKVATAIVDAVFAVHKALGAGLLESVYETCFCYELNKRGLNYCRQVSIPIIYDGIKLDDGFRVDVLVEDQIVCELKAVDQFVPIHRAQLLTYLKLTKKRLGFLINFNVPLIKNGIKRMAL